MGGQSQNCKIIRTNWLRDIPSSHINIHVVFNFLLIQPTTKKYLITNHHSHDYDYVHNLFSERVRLFVCQCSPTKYFSIFQYSPYYFYSIFCGMVVVELDSLLLLSFPSRFFVFLCLLYMYYSSSCLASDYFLYPRFSISFPSVFYLLTYLLKCA